jgi:N-carbamoyl-L-amino-acid hydrolase
MFVRRPGRHATAPPVLTGSHIDSQPFGGAYDGAYGVLAGFEVLEALDDAGVETERPVELAIWTNEEGSRFQPTTMGSAVFVGELGLPEAMAAIDAQGRVLRDELEALVAAVPDAIHRDLAFPMHAFLEAHIEQGPILEAEGKSIGLVRAIQGLRWFTLVVRGRAGHAGTTPPSARQDALVGAVNAIDALNQLAAAEGDRVRLTVGRLEVHPNSPNTIPGEVLFTVDLRHPGEDALEKLGGLIGETVRKAAAPCDVEVHETLRSPPTLLDDSLRGLVRSITEGLGLSYLEMDSGATHDAKNLALHTPTGMVFVPCRDGVSHVQEEYASVEWMLAGTRVLAGAVTELAA